MLGEYNLGVGTTEFSFGSLFRCLNNTECLEINIPKQDSSDIFIEGNIPLTPEDQFYIFLPARKVHTFSDSGETGSGSKYLTCFSEEIDYPSPQIASSISTPRLLITGYKIYKE